MPFRWISAPFVIASSLRRWDRLILEGLFDLMDAFAARAESIAKSIAPWMDRTGAARQGLRAFVERAAAGAALFLVHSVFYGIYLELGTRFMGPRPAIQPALEQIYGPLMAAIRALVGGR